MFIYCWDSCYLIPSLSPIQLGAREGHPRLEDLDYGNHLL